MVNINEEKIINYMFYKLQEAIENDDEEEAIEVEEKLSEFGFLSEAREAMRIIKDNFKEND